MSDYDSFLDKCVDEYYAEDEGCDCGVCEVCDDFVEPDDYDDVYDDLDWNNSY